MIEVGTIIGGRLRVDQLLGAGGMGVVAAATHIELGNKVAIKIMREELAQNPTSVERFIREARAVVSLRTEHVCRVFDVGRLDNGTPYIVMELLAGADLARAIQHRPLPVSTAVDYMMQACVALAEAHAAGIVHRDLKPANLFVTRRLDGGPLVKVLDFGIAKAGDTAGPHLTHTTGMMGSPGYMSPEQLQSARDVDLRTDIWALGVTLYQLVSGRMPFAAPTLTEIAIKVASDPPAPLDLDPELRAVIFRCLEKHPDRRYPSAAALAADLSRFASSDGRKTAALAAQLSAGPVTSPVAAPVVAANALTAASVLTGAPRPSPPTALDAEPAPTRRARWPFVLGALVLGGLVVGIALAIESSSSTPTPAPGSGSAPPAVVVVAVDAAQVAVKDDPWEPKDAAVADSEVEVEEPEPPEEPDKPMPDEEYDPATMMVTMTPKAKEQMRAGCKHTLDQKMLEGPVIWMSQAVCWCALGDVAKARALIAKIPDVALRNGARANCAMNGVKVPK